jgi:large subunit ribosomal protein L22
MFKRLMPRARGMAYLIRRRTAHINVGLADAASFMPDELQEAARGADEKD